MTSRVPRRLVFHVHGEQYHVEDSYRGVRAAIRRLFPWIDLDIHKSKNGTLWVTHWSEPMVHDGFFDPAHKMPPHKRIEDMTDDEIERLVTKDGYRIHKAVELIPWALKHGAKVEMEPKTPDITKNDFMELRRVLHEHHLNPEDVQVKAFPKFRESLRGAHGAYFTTILLSHPRAHLPGSDRSYLNYYRGFKPRWF